MSATMPWPATIARAQDVPAAPSFLNERERLPLPSLRGLNRLRFVTTLDFPPFNSLNDQGQLSGYHIDLARALCGQLGIDAICQIEALPWAELEQRLIRGEAEAIIAGWQPSEVNRKDFVFSRSYMRLPARFATRNNRPLTQAAALEVRDKTIGVIAGQAHEEILKAYFPQAIARPYPDRTAMLVDLKDGKVDAVFDDGMTLSLWLNNAASDSCCAFADGPYLAPQYLGPGFSIAVTQSNAFIAAAFDNALQSLQQKGTLTELYLRYFPSSFY
ncbi:transporter substrate-binding domain-containing protein [Brucella sp. BE17]|uniref:transporter substrate-binding domain-containing protein n=1 Tax=Brucella sp. BE17 TaxID=3142977 RepID=UPI0031BA8DA1